MVENFNFAIEIIHGHNYYQRRNTTFYETIQLVRDIDIFDDDSDFKR